MEKFNKKRLYIEIVKAIEGIVTIKEFEQWLYAQTQLQEQMDDDEFVWGIFALNYSQKSRIVIDELRKLLKRNVGGEGIEVVLLKCVLFDVIDDFSIEKMKQRLNWFSYTFGYTYDCMNEFIDFDDWVEFSGESMDVIVKEFKYLVIDFLLQLYQAESQTENFTLKEFVYKEKT